MAVEHFPNVDAKHDALRRIYEDADAKLSALVSAAIERGASGTARQYQLQRVAVHKVLADLQATAIPAATQAVSEAYVTGARIVEKLGALDKGFHGVHKDAIATLADNMVNKLNEAAVTVGRNVDDVFRKAALHHTAQGIITGETRTAISARMQRDLVQQGITGFVDKGGRRWSLGNYSKMVVRTTTREAVSHGTVNRMIENGQDLVTISEHSHDEDECSDYEGNTYSLTGDTPGYDVLDELPPFHPNCVHVVTPAAESFAAFDKAADEVAVTPDETAVHAPRDALDVLLAPARAAMAEAQVEAAPLTVEARQAARARMARLYGFAEADLTPERLAAIDRKIDEEAAAATEITEEQVTKIGQHVYEAAQQHASVLREPLQQAFDEAHAASVAARDAYYDAKGDEERAARQAHREAQLRRQQALDAKNAVERDAIVAVLERLRPGFGSLQPTTVTARSAVMDAFHGVGRFLPREWVEASETHPSPLRLKEQPKNGRGVYKHRGNHEATIEVPNDPGVRMDSVALHEFGHRVQYTYNNQATARFERAFYARRTAGETPKRLRDLFPNHGYKADEITREDQFKSVYMGKDYARSVRYEGQLITTESDPREILTMGLEGIFHGRHNLMPNPTLGEAGDVDYIHFILGLLAAV